MTLFYCAHWQAYVTGTLKMGRIDVTEAQFSIIAIHMISAILGADFWTTQVMFFTSIVVDFNIIIFCYPTKLKSISL